MFAAQDFEAFCEALERNSLNEFLHLEDKF